MWLHGSRPCTYVIVDIAAPPSGKLTIFNIYVTLSRSRGRQSIRILRAFNRETLFEPLDEALELEDARLERLNDHTAEWWNEMLMGRGEQSTHQV